MRSIRVNVVMLIVMAVGCATLRNTPAQDLAWERWKTCDHFVAVALERIDPDGRIVVKAYESEAAAFTACVREAAADQVRRGIATTPQAAVLVNLHGGLGGTM